MSEPTKMRPTAAARAAWSEANGAIDGPRHVLQAAADAGLLRDEWLEPDD